MTDRRDSLTEAETNVLALVDTGLSNQKIADTMSIAVGTVKCHLHRTEESEVMGHYQVRFGNSAGPV